MDTAEVLIAERGFSVSLREIAAHAGQRNNSAVIYHFGNQDGLIAATLERRMKALEERRLEMLDAVDLGGEPPISALVAIIVDPALTIPYLDGATHYARFVEQVRNHPVISNAVPTVENWPAITLILEQIEKRLPGTLRTRHRRIAMMATVMFVLIADFERRGQLGSTSGRKTASRELVAVLTAVLTID
ncbi:TetR/AcrR family transcriptional regulator [Nocardia aobensis]|uniref:TetR/AcrR family transcriptional regulator n=1 Tax=Nocardia aobensis TaxID=257277 RepID=A0ABW6NZ60_9NOCA